MAEKLTAAPNASGHSSRIDETPLSSVLDTSEKKITHLGSHKLQEAWAEMKNCFDRAQRSSERTLLSAHTCLLNMQRKVWENMTTQEEILERLDMMLRQNNARVEFSKRRVICETLLLTFVSRTTDAARIATEMRDHLRQQFLISQATYERHRVGLERAINEKFKIEQSFRSMSWTFFEMLKKELL